MIDGLTLPSEPDQTYLNKGWLSWGDFLGTGYIAPINRQYLSFDAAREYARNLGLRNQKEWYEWTKQDKPDHIPANPNTVYGSLFRSWGDWLGTDWVHTSLRQYRDFLLARDFARSLKLSGQKAWYDFCRSGNKPDDIPANPEIVYRSQWVDVSDWLGTYWTKNFVTFSESKKYAHSLGLQSYMEWVAYCKTGKKPKDIPSNPQKKYQQEWLGWGDFLGTGNLPTTKGIGYSPKMILRSFDEARKFARSLAFKNVKQWREWCKTDKRPSDIPHSPDKMYPEFESYGDWLGTKTISYAKLKFRSFVQARQYARNLQLRSCAEWLLWCKSGNRPQDISSRPDQYYRDQWISWKDWLAA